MKKLLALLLLALLASPLAARAQRLSVVPGDAVEVRGTVPAPPRPTPVPPETFPLDGAFVYQPDLRCGASSNVLPNLATALCMRTKAIEYVTAEVIAGRVSVGPAFRACSYPSDPAWPACIEYTLRNATPEIRWGQSPAWVRGAVNGVPWEGCAAGVSYGPFIRVSFADSSRTMKLVSWETGNVMLLTLDRYTATDGPIVGAATQYAAIACGVQ